LILQHSGVEQQEMRSDNHAMKQGKWPMVETFGLFMISRLKSDGGTIGIFF